MVDQDASVLARRAVYLGCVIVGGAILIPAMPAIASAFEPAGSGKGSGDSYVVSLEVIAPGRVPAAGQIPQPGGQSVFVTCPSDARILGGGYVLPPGSFQAVIGSAPTLDSRQWTFTHAGGVPIGTKYYAVCGPS